MESKKIESLSIDGETYPIEQMSEKVKRLVNIYESTVEKARKAEEEGLVYSSAIQTLGPMIVAAIREDAAKALKQSAVVPAAPVDTPAANS